MLVKSYNNIIILNDKTFLNVNKSFLHPKVKNNMVMCIFSFIQFCNNKSIVYLFFISPILTSRDYSEECSPPNPKTLPFIFLIT